MSFLTDFHLGKSQKALLTAPLDRITNEATAGRNNQQALLTLQKKGLIEISVDVLSFRYTLTGAGEKCREVLLNA